MVDFYSVFLYILITPSSITTGELSLLSIPSSQGHTYDWTEPEVKGLHMQQLGQYPVLQVVCTLLYEHTIVFNMNSADPGANTYC